MSITSNPINNKRIHHTNRFLDHLPPSFFEFNEHLYIDIIAVGKSSTNATYNIIPVINPNNTAINPSINDSDAVSITIHPIKAPIGYANPAIKHNRKECLFFPVARYDGTAMQIPPVY